MRHKNHTDVLSERRTVLLPIYPQKYVVSVEKYVEKAAKGPSFAKLNLNMEYHAVVSKIENLLKEIGIAYKRFEHAPVRTSEEAAAVRPDYTMAQGAKALIVRAKKAREPKKFVMFVVPGDRKLDTKKVKNILGYKDIRFATEDEIQELTDGVKPGGLPPFGNLFGLETIADKNIFKHREIIFNAGDKRVSIAVSGEAYRRSVSPLEVSVT